MSKKMLLVMSILLMAAMVLTSCKPAAVATEAPAAAVETAAPAEKPFKVGFVTDTGGIDDKSFNTTQWNGVLKAQTELGIEPKFIQSDEAAQYVPNLTEFASQGYDLIIAAGWAIGADMAKVAMDYPDLKFSIVDYSYPDAFIPDGIIGKNECVPNAIGQEFLTDQPAFLAGYLAAGMTKTGKVGYFGGKPYQTVTIFAVGMQAGIEAYNAAHPEKNTGRTDRLG